MYTIHATQKLRDKVKAPLAPVVEEPTTVLGNWYATTIPWRSATALFVNERYLLSVLLPLAPAKTVADRFPDQLGLVLAALGAPPMFVADEVAATTDERWAKTASRSMTGTQNEFIALLDRRRRHRGPEDLVVLATHLADIPCTPLYREGGHRRPQRELAALVEAWPGPGGAEAATG